MHVEIFQLPWFDEGAYRIVICIDASEQAAVETAGVAFEIPNLAKRRIYPDDDYAKAVCTHEGIVRAGVFKKGAWKGHCYTNGVSEGANPTSIEDVRTQLEQAVNVAIENARSWLQALGQESYPLVPDPNL